MEVYFHLDLKGAPPKPVYLKRLWPLLKNWSITGVIIEWEDCFPYTGNLEYLTNKIYSMEDSQQIVQDIHDANLEVIPLVQSFGHLEFVLKHPVNIAYREVPIYPSSLCPSHPNAINLINSMLEQVIDFHCGIKKFHIGADEVWHMAMCDRCKIRINDGESKEDLFMMHVKAVLENLKHKFPDVQLIMWDDMLRSMDEAVVNAYNLKPLVEPMVWHYNSGDSFCLPPDIWQKYSNFGGVWVAGAFKGASGGSQLVPPVDHHANNALQWVQNLKFIKTPIRGVVLTGWSRYDHFAALCELLPCGLLSLGVCMRVLMDKTLTSQTSAVVEAEIRSWILESVGASKEDQVLFNSWKILNDASRLLNLRQSTETLLNSDKLQTWMNEWQVVNRRVNPMQLVPLVPTLQNIVDVFNDIEKSMRERMCLIFYDSTVEEWIGTNITSSKTRVKEIQHTAERLIAEETSLVEELGKNVEMDC